MNEYKDAFRNRLENIWKAASFTTFFQTYSKRSPLHMKKGHIIFYEGDQPDRLYCITKGFVKLYHLSEEGKDATVYLYGPGSVLGVRALTSKDQALKHNAQAITDIEIVTISRKEYLDIIVSRPEFFVDLLHVFIDRLNYTERKLEGFITSDATARVANFLLDCAKRFGIKRGENIILPFPLTHQLIADFVGSFRETVTLAIHRLEKEKIIKFASGKVTVRNMAQLTRYASGQKKSS